jgi:hypothetical protein
MTRARPAQSLPFLATYHPSLQIAQLVALLASTVTAAALHVLACNKKLARAKKKARKAYKKVLLSFVDMVR